LAWKRGLRWLAWGVLLCLAIFLSNRGAFGRCVRWGVGHEPFVVTLCVTAIPGIYKGNFLSYRQKRRAPGRGQYFRIWLGVWSFFANLYEGLRMTRKLRG
jgi:hypothetical protein